ncbi:MAG: polyprenyl synthetase family protein [Clostridia bacterium]|nr:polyprenyl synthetase family protein [Clostridia bacterium]
METKLKELGQKVLENAARTEEVLAATFEEKDEDLQKLFDAEAYSLLGGGKRIRTFLVNEFCRSLGGDLDASMPYACALEMIHTYSLIHDDLPCMDDDDIRRGKPANHKQFGYATALLAGDALLTKAFLVAATNPHATAEQNAEAVRLLASAAGDRGMIGGQIMDLHGETEQLSFEQLIRLHSMKTAALMECSALLGCLAAGYSVDTPEAKAAREYAKKVGITYQVIDDILDESGEEDTIGKNLKTDSSHNKTTFMTYFNAEDAKKYAQNLTAEAVSALSDWETSATLTDLAAYLVDRTY